MRVNKKEYRKFQKEGYTIEELQGYYKELYSAYIYIISQQADAIISPLRGSEILIKTINLFASLNKNSSLMPRIYYPKTGQINSNVPSKKVNRVVSSYQTSIPEKEQKREMNRIIDKILTLANSKNKRKKKIKIIFIDEVYSGGALVQGIKLLESIIKERNLDNIVLSIVAIADARKQRCPAYLSLKTRKKIREFEVPRLFTTDSLKFLYPLRKEVPKFFQFSFPFKRKPVERVFSKFSAEHRLQLLADLEALHTGRNLWRLRRLPTSRHIFLK
ncbi:MAG: hypothetical protein QXZ13_03355 [Candidatus Diapherotrites archaeon]